TSGMRKPPPISTSSPRATMTSLREASAASASSTAAALLFATTPSSAPESSASRRDACPCRSPRRPASRLYSTLTAPAAPAIAAGLAIRLRRQLALELDVERTRAEREDVPSVHVRAAIELCERDQRCPPPEITGYDDIEEPVVDLRLGSDVHTAAEMRAVRG